MQWPNRMVDLGFTGDVGSTVHEYQYKLKLNKLKLSKLLPNRMADLGFTGDLGSTVREYQYKLNLN